MSHLQTKTALVGTSIEEFRQLCGEFGQPPYRAEQIYKWIHHHQVRSFAEMSDVPKQFRQQLEGQFTLYCFTLVARQDSQDGTRKYLWQLPDGKQIESVFIPETTRHTICISSQVGCALGCEFCATARMGYLRNLTVGEIVEQVIRVKQDTGQPLTNVVFMGMGEPFLNYSRVIQASHILRDPRGLAISGKKITISTVGIVPRIRQFSTEAQPFSLAISLHAPTQALRRQLIPVADKFSLDELISSAHEYTRRDRRKRITFEYVLLEGVNDSPELARKLRKLLSPLRCKLNLIPYNETGPGFRKPSSERLEKFLAPLAGAPFAIMVRKNRGNDISAACGQLFIASGTEQKARFLPMTETR